MITVLLNQFCRPTKNTKKSLLFLLLAFFALSNFKLQAQVNTYNVQQLQITTPYTAVPVNVITGSPTTGSIDNGVYPLTLPFNFQFAGVPYTTANSINISYNGFLTFGATAPAAAEYFPISGTGGYAGAISPFGTDLDLAPANATTLNISTQLSGAPGNQILKIQWTMKRSSGLGTAASIDGVNIGFQVWLYENGSVIEMHYNTNATVSANESLAQIGLRGSSNTDFLNFNYGSPLPAHWPGIAPAPVGSFPLGTVNTQTVKLRGSAQILANSNRTIRFTPVTCSLPSAISVSNLITTATATWTPPSVAPAQGYDYEIRINGSLPSSGIGPNLIQSGNTATSPLSITGLSPNTTYCLFVRSHCVGADFSGWSTGNCFTTLCAAASIPYYRDFNNTVISGTSPFHGPIPTCTSQQNMGLGNPWVTADANNGLYLTSNMFDGMLMYNGTSPGNGNDANVWFYTEGINLVAGTDYFINYLYGGTILTGTNENKLQVAYGTAPNSVSMTNQIEIHPSIKGSAFNNIYVFTAPSTGVFYFGFKAFSLSNNGQMYVDDIIIEESNCKKPTAVSVSAISGSTAQLSWTPPTPVPSTGYAYYVSLSPTPPGNNTTPTGFTSAGVNNVLLTGLNGSTNYYFWVRSNCGGSGFGQWVPLVNGVNSYFTTLVQINYCASTSTLNQNYFTSFTTTNAINNVSNPSGYGTSGYSDFTSNIITQAIGSTVTHNTTYNSMAFGVGIAMWVDWNQDGTFDNTTERVYNSASYLTAPPTATFTVPATALLGFTRMRIVVDYNSQNPSACGVVARGETEDYGFQVITAPPPLTLSSNAVTLCAFTTSPLITITQGLGVYDTFTWSPAVTGTSGGGYNINTGTTQVYTLTAQQTLPPFRFNTVTFKYTATPLPTPIIITTPSGNTVCQAGPAIRIDATGGIASGEEILKEDFNGATNSWSTTNTGTLAYGIWTLRPNNWSEPLFVTSSNDASQFYQADSDGLSSGAGTTTITNLTSPVFNTIGFTQASLSFWQYYLYLGTESASVQISLDNTTWTDLVVYTSTQGAPRSFSNVNIPLGAAYLNQPALYLRFRYVADYDWNWAIDNVFISGTKLPSIKWTPAAGLYTDALATVPYNLGDGASTLYAMPSATQIYTATAQTTTPVCPTTTNVTINVTPIVAGSIAGAPQTICDGAPSNLTISGYSGTISEWQSSPILAFTTPTTIAGSAGQTVLTSALMGTITSNTYYRVKITNGVCVTYTVPVLISFASVSWNGSAWSNGTGPTASIVAVFNGPYTSALGTAGNLTACSVIVNSGNVVFSSGTTVNGPGATLTAINAVKVLGGSLTFNNNSSLLQVNEATNTGAINYKRDTTPMKIYDFTYWSSPVLAQEIHSFSTATLVDKFFFWDTTPAYYNWRAIPASPPYNMIVGKGYIIRAPQSFTTTPSVFSGVFTGVPINGLQTVSVETTALGTKDLNLVGNPYPSAIWADLFLTNLSNAALFNKTIYLWTHNTAVNAGSTLYNNNDYASYNLTGGVGVGSPAAAAGLNTNVPNGYIAAGQAFFIQGKTVGVGAGFNATFTNSMRVAGSNNQFFRNNTQSTTSIEKNRIWLEVSNGVGAYKQLLYGYIEGATTAKDSDFDGDMIDIGNQMNIYTLIGTNKMSIQGVGLPFNNQDLVPVGYKSTVSGNFDIQLSDFDGLFVNQNIYLEDKLLNVIVDLKQNPYTFTASPGTFNDRFVLRFTNGTLAVNTLNFNDTDVVVYKTKNDIHITTSNMNMKSVSIFDLRGRELFTKTNVNNNVLVVSNLNLAQQVIIVQVTNDQGIIVNKKIVF